MSKIKLTNSIISLSIISLGILLASAFIFIQKTESQNIAGTKKIKPLIVLEDQNRPSLSFDGSRVVAGPEIGLSEVFNVDTGKKLRTFVVKDSESQTISADGKRVRIFGNGIHTSYDIDTGEMLLQDSIILYQNGNQVGHVAVIGEAGLNTKNISSDLSLVADQYSPKSRVNLDPNSPMLILGRLEDHVLVREFRTDDSFLSKDFWWRVSMTPDGKVVAATRSNIEDKQRHRTTVWDAETGKVIFSLPFHSYWISLSNDGRRIITSESGDNGKIQCWDVSSGKLIATLTEKDDGRKVRISWGVISPDGKILVTLGNEDFYFWSVNTGKFIAKQKQDDYSDGFVTSVTFSGDGKRIAVGSDTEVVTVWSVEDILKNKIQTFDAE